MDGTRALVAGAALLMIAAADAPWSGEFALPAADAGFVLGWISPAGNMREFVPTGKTVDRWTRMITVQQNGYRVGLTPAVFLARFLTLMRQGCPGLTEGATTPAPLGDHAGFRVSVACPLNPATRLPETVTVRIVMGDQGLQMVQAAARRAFTADDRRWADGVADGIVLCEPAAAAPRCVAARGAMPGSPL